MILMLWLRSDLYWHLYWPVSFVDTSFIFRNEIPVLYVKFCQWVSVRADRLKGLQLFESSSLHHEITGCASLQKWTGHSILRSSPDEAFITVFRCTLTCGKQSASCATENKMKTMNRIRIRFVDQASDFVILLQIKWIKNVWLNC